jgi:hypothetical protein
MIGCRIVGIVHLLRFERMRSILLERSRKGMSCVFCFVSKNHVNSLKGADGLVFLPGGW